MDLWWRLRGWARLRLTSADCVGRMRELGRERRLEHIEFLDDLTVEFDVQRSGEVQVRDGEKLEVVRRGGVPAYLAVLARWKILCAFLAVLLVLTLWLPTRMWFIRVEGNGEIPARRILEAAEECGVYFGAPVRELRSEQVKNHLLWAIPELRWAGVNTSGCTATITVAVRDGGAIPEDTAPGALIACTDGVVPEVYPGAGTVLARPGQAVKAGDILISGTSDLGITTRVERAEGEVYALTERAVTAVLPEMTLRKGETGSQRVRYALLIGKKRMNFPNDTGILYGTCVKMRTVNYLKLPGGFELPVALVTERYVLCETKETVRDNSEEILAAAARSAVEEAMIAGTILTEDASFQGHTLPVSYSCREMIARFRPGVYLERDTNDRENGERRTG